MCWRCRRGEGGEGCRFLHCEHTHTHTPFRIAHSSSTVHLRRDKFDEREEDFYTALYTQARWGVRAHKTAAGAPLLPSPRCGPPPLPRTPPARSPARSRKRSLGRTSPRGPC